MDSVSKAAETMDVNGAEIVTTRKKSVDTALKAMAGHIKTINEAGYLNEKEQAELVKLYGKAATAHIAAKYQI